jgi:foldase protein PrsA
MNYAFFKSLLSAAFLTLGAAAVIGCGSGDSVPSGSVATVGDEEITQEEFDKWLKTAVSGQAQGAATVVPDPPEFTKCVAAKKDAPVPKGQEKPSDAALKKQCKQEYDTLKREVMLFLIQAKWVEQEAEEQGVEVSDASVRKSFEDQ